MEKFSTEKASKFKEEHRYFNVNHLWAPGFMRVVEILYYTPVRPEFIVLTSLFIGIIASYLYSMGEFYLSLPAAVLVVIKNYFDNVDGHLARAKGMASRLGRFLDSLADALVYLCLFTGIAYNLAERNASPPAFGYAYFAMTMAFIQCSFYNYYLVSYKTCLYGEGINKTDESREDEKEKYDENGFRGLLLFILHWIYRLLYGWQDKLVAAVDKKAYQKFKLKNDHLDEKEAENIWYTNKKFVTLFSPLCFGTQIFTLFLFTICDNIAGFLISLIVPWNIYLLVVYFLKINSSLRKKNETNNY
ncbi:MAG: CDP-alcohol phosphatidyltransferase family protein [Deltaproteobacteria bacterium]|nr:CDP-alcohol phosphatidyltransferase family protein [Deltaproteobacteria bacterium]